MAISHFLILFPNDIYQVGLLFNMFLDTLASNTAGLLKLNQYPKLTWAVYFRVSIILIIYDYVICRAVQCFLFSVVSYTRFSLVSFIHILGVSIFSGYFSSRLFPIAGVSVSYSCLIFIGLCSLLYWSLCLFFACVILYEVVIWLGEFKYGMNSYTVFLCGSH